MVGGEEAVMLSGMLSVACLLAVAGAPDVVALNQNKFEIPIRILPERRSEIRELELYVSTNQGKNWNLVAKATPDKDRFGYFAQGDGQYWFSVVIIDQQGRSEPRDLMAAPVGQKILVDTLKPEVRLTSVERQGDEVVVRWEIREENPDQSTFRLEYRTDNLPPDQWIPVSVNTVNSTGQAHIRPGNQLGMVVRLSLMDLAKNSGQADSP